MALVTDKVAMQMEKSYKACEFLWTLPFCWRNGAPAVTETPRKLTGWLLSALIAFILMAFCLGRLIESNLSSEWTFNSRIYLQMILVMICLPAALHGVALLSRYDIVRVTGKALHFFKNANYIADESTGKAIGALSLLLTFARISSNSVSCLYTINILVNPNSPELITSTLKKSWWLWKVIFFPFLYAMSLVTLNCARVGAPLLVNSVIPILLWSGRYLRKMRNLLRTGERSNHALLMEYKRLAILISEVDVMVAVLLPVWKIATVVPAVFSAYAVTKLDGVVGGLAAIYACVCITTLQLLIKLAAEITQESIRFLNDFKRYGISRKKFIYSKKLASLRPLRISVRKMYFLDKALMIIVMRIIMENTITVFLLHS